MSGFEGRVFHRLLIDGHPADSSTYIRVLKDALNVRVLKDRWSAKHW